TAGAPRTGAADNLFGPGRYLEGAGATRRLIRALGSSVRAPARTDRAQTGLPAVDRIQRLLVTWGAATQTSRSQSAKVAAEALQSEQRFGSAFNLIRTALRTATSLRERLSPAAG